jgi:hypothetical protein
MEVLRSIETANLIRTIGRYVPEDISFYNYRCKHVTSRKLYYKYGDFIQLLPVNIGIVGQK